MFICAYAYAHGVAVIDELQCVHGQRPLVGCMHESKHGEARIMGHAGVMLRVLSKYGCRKCTVKVYRESLTNLHLGTRTWTVRLQHLTPLCLCKAEQRCRSVLISTGQKTKNEPSEKTA